MNRLLVRLCLVAGLSLSVTVQAGETKVAVAANFTEAARDIAAAFQQQTGHVALLSFASTGKLYTQIVNGAPFEVFLAADTTRPEKAEQQGFAVAGSRFTYAKGKIVLYSASDSLVGVDGAVLKQPELFNKLAIANPVTAPYGTAATEAMKAMGVYDAVAPKLVQGDSIAQTYQFVATRNADLGFVALSQIIGNDSGSRWIVPEDLYQPIRQDAVLLKTGADHEAAEAFIHFLTSEIARTIITGYGYGLD